MRLRFLLIPALVLWLLGIYTKYIEGNDSGMMFVFASYIPFMLGGVGLGIWLRRR